MINPTEQVRAVLGVVQELVRNVYPDRHYLCSPSYYKRVYELPSRSYVQHPRTCTNRYTRLLIAVLPPCARQNPMSSCQWVIWTGTNWVQLFLHRFGWVSDVVTASLPARVHITPNPVLRLTYNTP